MRLKFSVGLEVYIQAIHLPVANKSWSFQERKGLHKNDTVVLGHRQTFTFIFLTISEKSFPLLFSFLSLVSLQGTAFYFNFRFFLKFKKYPTCCCIRNRIGCAHHARLWCRKVLLFMPSNSSDLELIHFLLYERVSEWVTEWEGSSLKEEEGIRKKEEETRVSFCFCFSRIYFEGENKVLWCLTGADCWSLGVRAPFAGQAAGRQ